MKGSGKLLPVIALGAGAILVRQALRRRRRIDFRGRSVVITGGSRGLGLVLARLLAAEGARLTLLARDSEELERARQDLAPYGAQVLTFPCDVSQQYEAQAAIARVIQHYGRIDVLINNAGVIQVGPIEHMQSTDFAQAMAVHMWGPLYMMLAAVPHMRRQGGGRIVNIASIGGKVAVPHLTPYTTSKFALVGLSDGMRTELAKDGIAVTTVCPGLMRTGSHLNASFKGQHQKEFAWFALFAALPVTSIDAQRAARQILEACRYGDAQLIITVQARLLTVLHTLFPGLMAQGLQLMQRLLPGPRWPQGDTLQCGWESRSAWAPSLLTQSADRAAVVNNE